MAWISIIPDDSYEMQRRLSLAKMAYHEICSAIDKIKLEYNLDDIDYPKYIEIDGIIFRENELKYRK